MVAATGADLPTIVRLATLTPAERAGIGTETGSLETGKQADLLVLSRRLAVRRTIIGGVEHPV
jgi:N-acetylglucosamine-6-phosphate deacetylase